MAKRKVDLDSGAPQGVLPLAGKSESHALSESLEDYLEVIYDLSTVHNVARVRDIAIALGVSMSSVTGALKKLALRNFINYDKYQYITLTDLGHTIAAEIKGRHRILSRFLENVLGAPPAEAESNACRMEHALDSRVIDRFLTFLEYLEASALPVGTWADGFRQFRHDRQGARTEPLHPGEANLAELARGVPAVVTRIEHAAAGDPRIAQLGLLPGAEVTVREHDRRQGSARIDVNGESARLDTEDLRDVRVRVAPNKRKAMP